jgi:hypothetical protein
LKIVTDHSRIRLNSITKIIIIKETNNTSDNSQIVIEKVKGLYPPRWEVRHEDSAGVDIYSTKTYDTLEKAVKGARRIQNTRYPEYNTYFGKI